MRVKYDYTVPLSTLSKRLESMETALADKALRSALTGAAKPLKAKMKINAPKQTGNLAKSIGQRSLSKTAMARLGLASKYSKGLLVGPTRRVQQITRSGKVRKVHVGRLAHWLETGTKAHKIKPRFRDTMLRIARGWFAPVVKHPGLRARYWMANSNSSTQGQQAEQFHRALVRALERYSNA